MQQDPQPRILRSARLTHDAPSASQSKPIPVPALAFPFDAPAIPVNTRSRAKPLIGARTVIELISSDEESDENRANRKLSRIKGGQDDDDDFEILDHHVNGLSKANFEPDVAKRSTRGRGTVARGAKPNGLITAIRKRPTRIDADIGPSRTGARTTGVELGGGSEAGNEVLGKGGNESKPGIDLRTNVATQQRSGSAARSTRNSKPMYDFSGSEDEGVIPPPKRTKARGRNSSRTSSQQGIAISQHPRGMQVANPEVDAKDMGNDDALDEMVDPRDIGEAFFQELRNAIEEEGKDMQMEDVQMEDLNPAGPMIPPDMAAEDPQPQAIVPVIADPLEEPLPPAILGIEDIRHIVPLIISLIPDICPDHLDELIRSQVFADPERKVNAEDACTEVVARLFDTDLAAYPKAKDKKRKADAEAGPSNTKRFKIGDVMGDGVQARPDDGEPEYLENGKLNYKSEKARTDERQGWGYRKSVAKDIQNIFPDMSYKHISDITTFHLGLYVPTYIDLAFQRALPDKDRSYRPMKTARVVDFAKLLSKSAKSKGKGKKATKADQDGTVVYQEEKEFLVAMLSKKGDNASIESLKVLQPLEGDGDAECQCCFGDEHTEYMVRCRDGHQFCRDCLQRLLETALGDQKAPVHCMDGSGCKALFSDREIQKVLAPRMANSYLALVQRKELEAAGIENLETCPSCEFAIVIDNAEEKLFTCQHPECEVVSCRACKRPNHIPRTCAEASTDDNLDKRHTIEEAMTEALVRKCPKPTCQKPFLKESGCNKITCGSCGTVSCYVCRAIIKNGYQHFDQQPGGLSNGKHKCRLWDAAGGADPYQEEVANARAQAQQTVLTEAARLGQTIAQPDVDVPLPQDRGVVPARALAHPVAPVARNPPRRPLRRDLRFGMDQARQERIQHEARRAGQRLALQGTRMELQLAQNAEQLARNALALAERDREVIRNQAAQDMTGYPFQYDWFFQRNRDQIAEQVLLQRQDDLRAAEERTRLAQHRLDAAIDAEADEEIPPHGDQAEQIHGNPPYMPGVLRPVVEYVAQGFGFFGA